MSLSYEIGGCAEGGRWPVRPEGVGDGEGESYGAVRRSSGVSTWSRSGLEGVGTLADAHLSLESARSGSRESLFRFFPPCVLTSFADLSPSPRARTTSSPPALSSLTARRSSTRYRSRLASVGEEEGLMLECSAVRCRWELAAQPQRGARGRRVGQHEQCLHRCVNSSFDLGGIVAERCGLVRSS